MAESPLRRFFAPPERDVQQRAVEGHGERMKALFVQAYQHVEQGQADIENKTGQGIKLAQRRAISAAHLPFSLEPDLSAREFLAFYEDEYWLSRFSGGLYAVHATQEPPPPQVDPVTTGDEEQDALIAQDAQMQEEAWVEQHAAWEEKGQALLMGVVRPEWLLTDWWARLWSLDAPFTRRRLRELAQMERGRG